MANLAENASFYFAGKILNWLYFVRRLPEWQVLLILLLPALFAGMYFISSSDLQEWDESRNGINALEMYFNHDYLNLHYNNSPDTWNAKPPLLIWLITISYYFFGFNEFALRLPSFLAGIVFLIFVFKTASEFGNRRLAIYTVLILLSCKAVLASHIALTGDFDALLIMFCAAASYYFLMFQIRKKQNAIYLFAIFLAFAFLTKGPAALLIIPGIFLFLASSKSLVSFLGNRKVYIAMGVFLFIISLWIIPALLFSAPFINGEYGAKNSLETLFLHDSINRLTQSNFGAGQEYDPWFFFHVLDTRFNVWNYFFLIGIVFLLFNLTFNKGKTGLKKESEFSDIQNFCFWITVPVAIILSLAKNKHSWYMAPLFEFIALISAIAIIQITKHYKVIERVFVLLFIFLCSRHIYELNQRPKIYHSLSTDGRNPLLINKPEQTEPPQNLLLYSKWVEAKNIVNNQ